MAPARVTFLERVCYISNSASLPPSLNADSFIDEFSAVFFPVVDTDTTNVLRSRRKPFQFCARVSLGLFAHSAATGLMHGTLINTITPFLTLKAFASVVTESFPLCGYRRRPYLLLGWTLCLLSLFLIAFSALSSPYFIDPANRACASQDDLVRYLDGKVNAKAPASGRRFVLLMALATLGFMFADVAAEGVVVDFAQRQEREARVWTQNLLYAARMVLQVVAQLMLAIGLNSPDYGGNFYFGLSFSTVTLILATACAVVMPITSFFIAEEKHCSQSAKKAMITVWKAAKMRAFGRVMVYVFFSGVLLNASIVAMDPITAYWVRTSPLSLNLSSIMDNMLMVLMVFAIGKVESRWDWCHIITGVTIAMVAVDAGCRLLVIWGIVANEWCWLGANIVEHLPYGASFILSTYVVMEIVVEGSEVACYGLVMSVMNLSAPVALTATTAMNRGFAVTNGDIIKGSQFVRFEVTNTLLIMYAMKLLSLAFLPCLPAQRERAQELKRRGGNSPVIGAVAALIWSTVTSICAL